MSVREVAIAACQHVVPSQYPRAEFQEMTGGKFEPGFGSSCGFLTNYVLMAIGCRDARILNREVDGLAYMPGANISRLVGGAKTLGCWRTMSEGEPTTGDLIFCSNGPPSTEHVFVLSSNDGDHWHSYDGGSPAADRSQENTRQRVGADGLVFINGTRRIQGYVDLECVPTSADPMFDGGGLLASTAKAAAIGFLGYAAYRLTRGL